MDISKNIIIHGNLYYYNYSGNKLNTNDLSGNIINGNVYCYDYSGNKVNDYSGNTVTVSKDIYYLNNAFVDLSGTVYNFKNVEFQGIGFIPIKR
jgi:hypothetical protein